MAENEVEISELEFTQELADDNLFPVESATDTKATSLKILKDWLSSFFVGKTGNEDINGVKNFINSPTVPTANVSSNDKTVANTSFVTSKTGLVLPIGAIVPYGGSTTPSGYLLCNGSAVSRTTYANLFEAIGTTYGSGDGSTTFNVPNLTDKFIQGSGKAGTIKAAGLPNIWGKSTGFESESGSNNTNGAIKTFKTGTGWGGGSERSYRGIEFNASWYNSIYGASSTVQPPALTMRFYIKY